MNTLHELPDDLISGFLRQSYAGAVRQRLLAIERAVQSGQRHELIVRGLEQSGMNASMATFRKSLSRARIWWRKQLLMQMAQNQAQPQEPGKGLGNDAHSQPNAGQSVVVMPWPGLPPEVTPEMAERKQIPRTRSPAVAGRVDLDQFFKPKSVFTKT
jgi:hypothetical protein